MCQGFFSTRVLQQPANNPGYISPVNGVITEFGLAKSYGNIGLLAHNYLTGASFSKLTPGQEIRIVYGNGDVKYIVVEEFLHPHCSIAITQVNNTSHFKPVYTPKGYIRGDGYL